MGATGSVEGHIEDACCAYSPYHVNVICYRSLKTLYCFLCETPNLTMVIPAMDYIDESFTNSVHSKHTIDPAIWAAIQLAKKTLNWYYTLTDTSSLYYISISKFSFMSCFLLTYL